MVEKLADAALDQDWSVEHGADVEGNDEVIGDAHVHLLVLHLQFVVQSALLNVVLDDFGYASENDKRLSQLFRFDR